MKPIMFAIAVLAMLPGNLSAPQTQLTVRVSHADLDLNTMAGIKTLDRRIAAAARAVCPDTTGAFNLAEMMMARRCSAQVMKGTKPQRDRIVAASAGRRLADRTY